MKTSASLSLVATAMILALGAGACGKKEASAPTASAPASAPAAVTAAAPAIGGPQVGVPECDEYISKYQNCLSGKVPEVAQAALKAGFDQTITQWQQTAATAEGRTGLAMACRAALDASKQAMGAYGCEW